MVVEDVEKATSRTRMHAHEIHEGTYCIQTNGYICKCNLRACY